MIRFFGALEQISQKPLVNKNNSLNTRAKAIADIFENSYFICMRRDPIFLAQSLLQARIDIRGDVHFGLWVDNPNKPKNQSTDYVEDVCDQVMFHERKIQEQQQIIGSERFWIVSYEEFCRRPEELVKRVSEQILNQRIDIEGLRATLKPFDVSNKIRLDPELFEKIEHTLIRLKRTAERPS